MAENKIFETKCPRCKSNDKVTKIGERTVMGQKFICTLCDKIFYDIKNKIFSKEERRLKIR